MIFWVIILSTFALFIGVVAFAFPLPPKDPKPWTAGHLYRSFAMMFFMTYTSYSAIVIILFRANYFKQANADSVYTWSFPFAVMVGIISHFQEATVWSCIGGVVISPIVTKIFPEGTFGDASLGVVLAVAFIALISLGVFKTLVIQQFMKVSLPLAIANTITYAILLIVHSEHGGWIYLSTLTIGMALVATVIGTIVKIVKDHLTDTYLRRDARKEAQKNTLTS